MEVYCWNFRDLQKGKYCFIKSKFEYLNTMNLYLLISAKKQIFAYFQYLVCLNKILYSLYIFVYHVSFNLMSSNIDIISAGISIFDAIAIFVMSFSKK